MVYDRKLRTASVLVCGSIFIACTPKPATEEDVTVRTDGDSSPHDAFVSDEASRETDRPNPIEMDVMIDGSDFDVPLPIVDVPNVPIDRPNPSIDMPNPPIDVPNQPFDSGELCAPALAVNGAETNSSMSPLVVSMPPRTYPCFACDRFDTSTSELNLNLSREYLVTLWARGRLAPANVRRWAIARGCGQNAICASTASERGIATARLGPGLVALTGCTFTFQYEVEVPPAAPTNTSCATAISIGTNSGTFNEVRIESAPELYYSFRINNPSPGTVVRATSLMNTGTVGGFTVYSSCAGAPAGVVASAPNLAFLSGAGPTVGVDRLAAGTYYVVVSNPMPGIKYTMRLDDGAAIP